MMPFKHIQYKREEGSKAEERTERTAANRIQSSATIPKANLPPRGASNYNEMYFANNGVRGTQRFLQGHRPSPYKRPTMVNNGLRATYFNPSHKDQRLVKTELPQPANNKQQSPILPGVNAAVNHNNVDPNNGGFVPHSPMRDPYKHQRQNGKAQHYPQQLNSQFPAPATDASRYWWETLGANQFSDFQKALALIGVDNGMALFTSYITNQLSLHVSEFMAFLLGQQRQAELNYGPFLQQRLQPMLPNINNASRPLPYLAPPQQPSSNERQRQQAEQTAATVVDHSLPRPRPRAFPGIPQLPHPPMRRVPHAGTFPSPPTPHRQLPPPHRHDAAAAAADNGSIKCELCGLTCNDVTEMRHHKEIERQLLQSLHDRYVVNAGLQQNTPPQGGAPEQQTERILPVSPSSSSQATTGESPQHEPISPEVDQDYELVIVDDV